MQRTTCKPNIEDPDDLLSPRISGLIYTALAVGARSAPDNLEYLNARIKPTEGEEHGHFVIVVEFYLEGANEPYRQSARLNYAQMWAYCQGLAMAWTWGVE